jgi:hypothetical protein
MLFSKKFYLPVGVCCPPLPDVSVLLVESIFIFVVSLIVVESLITVVESFEVELPEPLQLKMQMVNKNATPSNNLGRWLCFG